MEKEKTGHWKICCDGWYPYCTSCGCEPNDGNLHATCPTCGATMIGMERLWDENTVI